MYMNILVEENENLKCILPLKSSVQWLNLEKNYLNDL